MSVVSCSEKALFFGGKGFLRSANRSICEKIFSEEGRVGIGSDAFHVYNVMDEYAMALFFGLQPNK